MAVQITDENLAYYLGQLSDSLENAEGARGCVIVTDVAEIANVLSIPGVQYDKNPVDNPDAVAVYYVQIPYSALSEAIAAAITAATNASSAATRANTASEGAEQAIGAANTAAVFAGQQGDYAKEWNDHPPYVADGTTEHRGDPYYIYFWDINTHAYVRGAYVKGADLDYTTMTQEEYNRLVENVKSSILFATVDTCESIVGELV